MSKKIEIFDTTLRDGAQGVGIEFSHDDKLRVIHALDSLGVTYIEAGMMTGERDAEFFSEIAALPLKNSRLTMLLRTCKAGESACENAAVRLARKSAISVITVFGKASSAQVESVLGTTNEENIRMIEDTVSYLSEGGREVIFDAEHFFDGYAADPDYAKRVILAAYKAGAGRIVLCDTNGATLPWEIEDVVARVATEFPHIKFGIHCHNDMGTAEAATSAAVRAGAVHVQGTVSGVGERCGNANLTTIIPLLQLRMDCDCVGENLHLLTRTAREVMDAANLNFDERSPFVGGYAFAHKAGTHIDAVIKSAENFEHIKPELVGNRRHLRLSSLAGRAAVLTKLEKYNPGVHFDKDDPRVIAAAEMLLERENAGYSYDDASASLELMIDEALGKRHKFFDLLELRVIVNETPNGGDISDAFTASAIIKISVDGCVELTAGEGNGPVNAIDEALRRALCRFYPEIGKIRLTDYRVRVLDSRATASSVRVSIESTDNEFVWRTVGVSSDVINASWQALRDSVEFKLKRDGYTRG